MMTLSRRGWLVLSLAGIAAVAAVGCPPDFKDEKCSTNADCFSDEVCVDGVCRLKDSTDDAGPVEISELTVEPASAEVEVDGTIQLQATATNEAGEEVDVPGELSWSSGDTSIATVEPQDSVATATVTGQAAGTTDITASVGDVEGSAEVTVQEGPVNNPPVADAGSDQTVTVGTSVELDGSGSMDPDMDDLSFEWAFTSTPTGSSASLSDTSAEQPTFTPDAVGDYEVELTVSDGDASATDGVTITAEPGGMDADTGDIGPDGGDTGVDTGGDTTGDTAVDTSLDTGADTAPQDTAPLDTAPQDTAPEDTSTQDTASQDTATQDTASQDTATQDTATQDTATQDTATQDTATQDTAVQDSGSQDTISSDTDTSP